MPASHSSKLHIPITNYHLLNARQESCKKSLTLNENKTAERFLEEEEKVTRIGHYQKTKKTERAAGLGNQKMRRERGIK